MKAIHKIIPQAGQESVWDYPRPPCLEECDASIKIIFNQVVIAESRNTKRVLETSHPPVYYIPPADIKMDYLTDSPVNSMCEWKGTARYYDLKVKNKKFEKAGWYYLHPVEAFYEIKGYVAFYAAQMDTCFVNGEKVTPQPGGFYGGWITANITGPFKGEPGTMFW